jgi:hypothetical protein
MRNQNNMTHEGARARRGGGGGLSGMYTTTAASCAPFGRHVPSVVCSACGVPLACGRVVGGGGRGGHCGSTGYSAHSGLQVYGVHWGCACVRVSAWPLFCWGAVDQDGPFTRVDSGAAALDVV